MTEGACELQENHDALLAFTARHPSLKERPFFISGESYAGIYIPTLAEVIMNKGGMNLQGSTFHKPICFVAWPMGLFSNKLRIH